MKKTTVFLLLSTLFISGQVFAQQNKGTLEIVPDLRARDNVTDKTFQGGTIGTVSSTVVISDDGAETIIYDKFDANNARGKDVKDRMDSLSVKKPTADASKVQTENKQTNKPAEFKATSAPKSKDMEVLPSLSGENFLADKNANDDLKKGVSKAVRPATPNSQQDRFVPEASISVRERASVDRVTEKMVPPSDDLIYGALKAQNLNDRAQPPKGGSGGGSDKPIVIDAIQGVNEIITVGKSDLNRFVTPFAKVVVRTSASEDELVSKVDGNVVYIGATKRSGVFLVEHGTGRAISLTVVPDDVPPRDIYLTMAKSSSIPPSLQMNGSNKESDADKAKGKSNSHVDYIKKGMREIALGKLPNGYTLMRPTANDYKCSMPNLKVRLGQVLEGSGNKYLVYRVDNPSNNEVVIDEQYCYKRGVIAVSAWPDVIVQPGGSTEVFVFMQMGNDDPDFGGRPSLIGRE